MGKFETLVCTEAAGKGLRVTFIQQYSLNTEPEINNPTTETCSVAFFSGLNFV